MAESISSTGLDLHDIITDDKFCANVARMFNVGTKRFQESGFAVYESTTGFKVSPLLVPPVLESDPGAEDNMMVVGNSFEGAVNLAQSFDASKLIITKNKANVVYISLDEHDMIAGLEAQKIEGLSDKARKTITAVQNDSNLDPETKENIVTKIVDRDRNEQDSIRTDILVLTHNHPLIPMDPANETDIGRTIESLMRPSPADINSYERIRLASKKLVEAIVGAAQKDRQILLYSASLSKGGEPSKYESRFTNQATLSQILEQLGIAGYSHVILELEDSGKPKQTPSNVRKLREFVCSLPNA